MAENIVLTGGHGFLGAHLSERLRHDHRVQLVAHPPSSDAPDLAGFGRAIRNSNATVVLHAGFLNRKPPTWSDAAYLCDAVATTLTVAEAAQAAEARLILVSSSAVYGVGEVGRPIVEDATLAPVTLYGAAKATQEMCLAAWVSGGLPVTMVRLFNLIGPGQQLGMLVPDWIAQAKAVLDGQQEAMHVPHVRTGRDFVDVRDASEAIASLVQQPSDHLRVFNVCSGSAFWLHDLHATLERLCGRPIPLVEIDPAPGPSDVRVQVGSFDRLRNFTGWQPTRSPAQSVDDAWHAARDR